MTIRYKCDSCGSVLNIKDEKAGTQGKCPKCKTPFLVPNLQEQTGGDSAGKPAAATQTAKPAAADDEFDPVAFLMEDDGQPTRRRGGGDKPAAGPDSDDEIPASVPTTATRRKRSSGQEGEDAFVSPYDGSASATADAMLNAASASAGAKELLTRTVEESRARAARLEEEAPPKEPSQFSLLMQELMRLSPYIAAGILAIVGLFYFVNSMVSTKFALPDLGYVSGRVTLNKEPLAGARVFFAPVEKDFRTETGKLIRVRTARGVTDESGEYELVYVDDIEGTGLGENRVWLERFVDGRDLIPGEYGPRARQTREVKAGSQQIDFELTAPTPPPTPPQTEQADSSRSGNL